MRLLLCILIVAMTITSAPGPARGAPDRDPWIGPDKLAHFSVSAALAGGAYGLSSIWIEDHRLTRIAIAAGSAIAVGIGKEIYDALGGGDPSWKDLTWDAIGVTTGVIIAWGIDQLISSL